MRLDLWHRLSKYDPSKATLNTFIAHVVEHKVASIIEARTASCRDYRRCPRSLNEPFKSRRENDPPVEFGRLLDRVVVHRRIGVPSNSPEDLHDLAHDIAAVVSNLPPELRDLCRRLMTDRPAEVSRETSIAPGTLYDARRKLRRRFEKADLHKYLQKHPALLRHLR
jgi:RNA polymerase sigma-70 factor (ECF subfamily)